MDHVTTAHERLAPRHRAKRGRGIASSLALLLAFSLVAAACGGGSGQDATSPGTGDVDPDGVIRIGIPLVYPSGIHLDPTQSAVNVDRQWMELVFGTLLRWTDDGRIEPWMAESYEVVDDQTVTLTLREGVTFADGAPYDGEAVRAGLLRTLNESSTDTVPSLSVAFKDITGVEVVDPLTVTITLGSPQAGELVAALADREGVIVSPAQAASAPDEIDSRPIGAGPFVVEEFVDAQNVVLSRNPDFFDADAWRLGGVEFIDVADGAAMVNGLLSDVVDLVLNVPPVDANRVRGDDRFVVESKATDRSYAFLNLCTGSPPFDDPDVRHALQLAIDRQDVSELVYDGAAEPANALWPEDHPYYNPAVEDIVSYDPEQAEELLGGRTVDMDLAFVTAIPEHSTVAEVLQSQLGEVGFDVTITPTQDPVSEFIAPQNPGALLIPGSRTGVDKYTRVFAEGQVQALCGQSRPEIVDTVAPAAALEPGSDEATEVFQEADLMVAEGAYVIPIVWSPLLVAWNDQRLGGEMRFYGSYSQPILETFHIDG